MDNKLLNKPLTRRSILKIVALTGVAHFAAPYIWATKAFAGNTAIQGPGGRFKKPSAPVEKVDCDVVLIGGGIMSATLGVFLKELDPSLKIEVFERLQYVALESSNEWNNAGTGHSALCELNYSPENDDHTVDISKAIGILEKFEVSKQFWSYLVSQGHFTPAPGFITSTPHMSICFGDTDAKYLRTRFDKMKALHLFKGMRYSTDKKELAEWFPLIMSGQNLVRTVASSRNELGTDVNFGELTRGLFKYLESDQGVSKHMHHEVTKLHQDRKTGTWHLEIKDLGENKTKHVSARRVFIGAGGGALPLLEKSGIVEGKGYGGFPVGGQFLVCNKTDIIERHHAKVYGKAGIGAPPMSVPHLDSRLIEGKKVLLFGPYAGFTTKFLKEGSLADLPLSIVNDNIKTMLGTGWNNVPLTTYLVKQVMQSDQDRLNALREFVPDAKMEDWDLKSAGQRVQTMKKIHSGSWRISQWGSLEFGTEVVTSADGSIAALLGASPGASSSVSIMIDVLNKCFKDEMKTAPWIAKMRQMIPTYGKHLGDDAFLTEKTRARTHEILGLVASK